MAAAATCSLNLSDLPEAKFWACKAKATGRAKAVGLPMSPESLNQEDDNFEMPPKEEEHSWCCSACTFRNPELLFRCEMCNTEKGARSNVNAEINTLSDSNDQVRDDDWPALPDARTKCDVDAVSIASSWLDIGEEDHAGSDEEDFLVVKAKPVLWSAVVGRSDVAVVPIAGKAAKAPLVYRKLAVEMCKKKAASTDGRRDEVWEELELRRTLRSAKQRRALTRRR